MSSYLLYVILEIQQLHLFATHDVRTDLSISLRNAMTAPSLPTSKAAMNSAQLPSQDGPVQTVLTPLEANAAPYAGMGCSEEMKPVMILTLKT